MADQQKATKSADGVSSSTVATSLAKPSGAVLVPPAKIISPTNNVNDDEEDEEVEYEEYEVDEDEEIDEEEQEVVKKPVTPTTINQSLPKSLNSAPVPAPEINSPKVQPKAPENPIEYEDEEYEEEEVEYEDEDEDEEVEYEEDDDGVADEPDPMADKIHELLNKASTLKQDAQQTKAINEKKLTSIATGNSGKVLPPKTVSNQTLCNRNVPLERPMDDQEIINKNNLKHAFGVADIVGTLPKMMKTNQNETNLASMKHCSNKWDITNLNDDEHQGGNPNKSAIVDSDDSDYDASNRDPNEILIKNPIMREKLNIHKAIMAQKNKSIYDRHDDEKEEDDIGEIEVALEENFIEEVDEEYESQPPVQDGQEKEEKDLRLKRDVTIDTDGSKTLAPIDGDDHHRTNQPETNISHKSKDGGIEDSQRNFAKEFIKDILDVAAAEARELILTQVPLATVKQITTTTAAANTMPSSTITIGAEVNTSPNKKEFGPKEDDSKGLKPEEEFKEEAKSKDKMEIKKVKEEEEGEDPYAIVPELLPNIQNTDLSKKYSIDLTNIDQSVLPTKTGTVATAAAAAATGGRIGHDLVDQQQDDGTWHTILKHIIIAFIIYLGFKYLFGLIF